MRIIKTVNPDLASQMKETGFTYTIEYLQIEGQPDPQPIYSFLMDDSKIGEFMSSFSSWDGDFFVGNTLAF